MHKGRADKVLWLLLLLSLYPGTEGICSENPTRKEIGCKSSGHLLNVKNVVYEDIHCKKYICSASVSAKYYADLQANCTGQPNCTVWPSAKPWPKCRCYKTRTSSYLQNTDQFCLNYHCHRDLQMLDLCGANVSLTQGYIYHAWDGTTDATKDTCTCHLNLKRKSRLSLDLVNLFFYASSITRNDCFIVFTDYTFHYFCGHKVLKGTNVKILNSRTSAAHIVLNYSSPLRGVFWMKFESDDNIAVECSRRQRPRPMTFPSKPITSDYRLLVNNYPSEGPIKPIWSSPPSTDVIVTTGNQLPNANKEKSNGNQSLSAGGAAGIAVVLILVIAVLVGLAILCIRKRKLRKSTANGPADIQQTNVEYFSSTPDVVLGNPGLNKAPDASHNSENYIAALYAKPNKQKKDNQPTKVSDSPGTKVKPSTGPAPDERKSDQDSEDEQDHRKYDIDKGHEYDYVTADKDQQGESVGASEDQTYDNVKGDHNRYKDPVSEDSQYDYPRLQKEHNYDNVLPTQGHGGNESSHEESDDDDTQLTDNPVYT